MMPRAANWLAAYNLPTASVPLTQLAGSVGMNADTLTHICKCTGYRQAEYRHIQH